ncbi:MAG: phosphoribosyltransferase family protein [Pseudomonadota bacterium]
MRSISKVFVEEKSLLNDSYRLAVKVFESGFQPDFIVGIWRGGSTVGIYVQECLQYLGLKTDHIAIRTSYRGLPRYFEDVEQPERIRVHGLQYLYETMNRDDRLLIVDDVFSSGQSIDAVISRLAVKSKRNMPTDVRIAVPYFKPGRNRTARNPDFYLHETDDWLVLPYELSGLSPAEIAQHKPWMRDILASCEDT